jgi:hypothetical protein
MRTQRHGAFFSSSARAGSQFLPAVHNYISLAKLCCWWMARGGVSVSWSLSAGESGSDAPRSESQSSGLASPPPSSLLQKKHKSVCRARECVSLFILQRAPFVEQSIRMVVLVARSQLADFIWCYMDMRHDLLADVVFCLRAKLHQSIFGDEIRDAECFSLNSGPLFGLLAISPSPIADLLFPHEVSKVSS